MKAFFKLIFFIVKVVIVAALAIAVWNLVTLGTFYHTAEKAFVLPGIDDPKFDMQGISYDEQSDLFFFGGYMRNNTAGPIYLVDRSGATVKKVLLMNQDGSAFLGHAGGLTVHGDWVYVAGSKDCCLYVWSRQEILDAENGAGVLCKGSVSTALSETDGVKVSFTADSEKMLFVGEFTMPILPQYQLRENHKLSINGVKTSALMVGFAYDASAPFGLSPTPSMAIALPDFCQGAVIRQDSIILSKSWMYVPSTISTCTPVQNGTFTIMNTEVPLYTLQETAKLWAIPMSEEIQEVDGKIYIACELQDFVISGIGNLWDARWCYRVAVK